LDLLILFVSGLFAGALNTLAGGGSFVIFPALMFVGVPPIMANATNTFACLPGYGSGAIGFWSDIQKHRDKLLQYSVISLIAGYLGAEALLVVSDAQFSSFVPWLMAFAVVAFAFGSRLNDWLTQRASIKGETSRFTVPLLAGLLALICFYGGFFNAGLGIILLAYFAVAGLKDLNEMNGLKLYISFLVSITAVIRFAFGGNIAWLEGFAALVGATLGGYIAARLAYLIPNNVLRIAVLIYAIGLTVYFFYKQYVG